MHMTHGTIMSEMIDKLLFFLFFLIDEPFTNVV